MGRLKRHQKQPHNPRSSSLEHSCLARRNSLDLPKVKRKSYTECKSHPPHPPPHQKEISKNGFTKGSRILKDELKLLLSEWGRRTFPQNLWVFKDNGRGKKESEGESQDMFVLFLNPRPQFRVKEHSDAVLPPLSPSAEHKNQNLHTYAALGQRRPLPPRTAS